MKTELVQLLSVILTIFIPADVAPPGEFVAAVSVGLLLGLACLGAVIITACILVIRAIKKSHAPKNDV